MKISETAASRGLGYYHGPLRKQCIFRAKNFVLVSFEAVLVSFAQLIAMFSCKDVFRTYILKMFENMYHSKNESTANGNSSNIEMTDVNCFFEPYATGILYGIIRAGTSLSVALLVENHRRRVMYLISGR